MTSKFEKGFRDAVQGVKQEEIYDFDLDYINGFNRGNIALNTKDLIEEINVSKAQEEVCVLRSCILISDYLLGRLHALEDALLYLNIATSDRSQS